MTRPTPHPKTGIYRLRKAVPTPLRPVIGKRELIISLRTKDPAEARRRAPEELRKIEARIVAARAFASAAPQGRPLTFREIVALCGEWYRVEVAEYEDNPGDPEGWDHTDDALLDKLRCDPETGEPDGYEPGDDDLAEARRFLGEQGIAADGDSLLRFSVELWATKRKAAATLQRRSMGDYSPDPVLASFPIKTEAPRKPEDAKPALALLTGEVLLDAWAAEAHPSPATRRKYAATYRHLARILGFDDVRRIVVEDVVRFKTARLSQEGRDPGTVADDVLAAGAVCKWATTNRLLPSNPFAGLAPKVNRRGPAAREPYDDAEAARILKAAQAEDGWLRWLPWLLCFTGARIGELVELRRGDVRQEAGVWFLDVKPTAQREGKNATFQRLLPLHPAVIAEGFLGYVGGLPADLGGPLFPSGCVTEFWPTSAGEFWPSCRF